MKVSSKSEGIKFQQFEQSKKVIFKESYNTQSRNIL